MNTLKQNKFLKGECNMNNKKFISLLCTTAMAASTFAALSVTANAEDTVLYSNSFDGFPAETMIAFSRNVDDLSTATGWAGQIEEGNEPFKSLYENNTPSSYEMEAANGNSLTVLCGTGNIDDTSVVYSKELSEGDNYLSMPRARFSNKNGGMSLTGFDAYTANSGEDLLVSFKMMLDEGDGTVPAAFSIGDLGSLSTASNVTSGQWYNVRVIIGADGNANVYLDGAEEAILTKSGGSLATGFVLENNSEGTKCTTYPTVNFDELVIMSVAAGTGQTVEVQEAEDIEYKAPTPPEELPSPAPLEDEVTFDFESDETSLALPTGSNFTATIIDDETTSSKVLQVAATSEKTSAYANAALDISQYTAGKSHVKLTYDSFIPNTGRMVLSLLENAPTAYNDGGIFWLGVSDSNGYRINGSVNAAGAGVWVNSVVDMDFENGAGTYTVKAGETELQSSTFTITAETVKTINFLSWSPNTSMIDNIKIETGGTHEIEQVDPETPSDVAGSGLTLVPTSASETIATYAPSETAEILNHATAGVAVTTDNTAINAYSGSARGYSIYSIYDIYLEADSAFSLTPYGNNGQSQASTMKLSSDAKGVVTVSTIQDGGNVVSSDNTLVHKTWYRVVVEVPQAGTQESTTTGNLTYTVYRIDPADPTKVKEVAAKITDISARGIAERGVSSFGIAVTGTAYIDNMATFRATGGLDLTPEKWYSYTATYDSDGILQSVNVEEVADPSAVVPSTGENTKTFVWNNNMKPYVAE